MNEFLLAVALIASIIGTFVCARDMSVPMDDNDKEKWGFHEDEE